eukprot:COSAG05_NODE_2943_length_2479_cov_1.322269_1_plen_256_part_00
MSYDVPGTSGGQNKTYPKAFLDKLEAVHYRQPPWSTRFPGIGERYLARFSFDSVSQHTGAWPYNRPCAQQYVGKYQSCMFISGRLIVHAPVISTDTVVIAALDVTSTPCAPALNVVRDNRYCFLQRPPPPPPPPTAGCIKCPASHPFPYGGPVYGSFCCSVRSDGHGCASKKICCLTPGSHTTSPYGDDGCEGIIRCGTNPANKTACVAPPSPPKFTDYNNIAKAAWKNLFTNNTQFQGCAPSLKTDELAYFQLR